MTAELSIIVCTRNRAASLARCLESLTELDAPFPLETIVVDNGSLDDTAAICARQAGAKPGFRAIVEPVVGLSRARNRGAREASSALVAYLDDDATPERGWAAALVTCFQSTDAVVVGGPILPRFETRPPAVITRCDLGAWSCQDLGGERREIRDFPYLFGANFAVRREQLLALGGFDETLGRRDASLLSGEDVDLCERVVESGGRIVYEPRAVVHHWIPAHRLSSTFFRERALATGKTRAFRLLRRSARGRIATVLAAKAAKLPAHAALWAVAAASGHAELAAEHRWSVFATLGMFGHFTRLGRAP